MLASLRSPRTSLREGIYNKEKPLSSLGDLTPSEFAEKHEEKKEALSVSKHYLLLRPNKTTYRTDKITIF